MDWDLDIFQITPGNVIFLKMISYNQFKFYKWICTNIILDVCIINCASDYSYFLNKL